MKDKKLVTVLIVIIVLLLIGGAYMFGVKQNIKNSPENCGYNGELCVKNQNIMDEVKNDNWAIISENGLHYNTKWQVTPELYRTPAQQENGEPLSIVGYRFTLPSGNTISYGGRQNGCTMSEAQNEALIFKYGISQSTCIKDMKAYLGLSNVRKTLPQEDINLFGDFVLRNQ
jgi:hypothetical protein